MSNSHYQAGLPEWADQDTADEAAAAVGVTADTAANDDQNARALRESWGVAARFWWAQAYQAMKAGDFGLMRTAARQAEDAEQTASPEGALLAAIFGQNAAPEAAVIRGARLSRDVADAARRAVKAEMASRQQTTRTQRQAAPQRPAPAVEAQTTTLTIGQRLVARVPYRLAKKSSGLAYVDGGTVTCSGVGDGDTVQITAIRSGKSYGIRYDAEATIVR